MCERSRVQVTDGAFVFLPHSHILSFLLRQLIVDSYNFVYGLADVNKESAAKNDTNSVPTEISWLIPLTFADVTFDTACKPAWVNPNQVI